MGDEEEFDPKKQLEKKCKSSYGDLWKEYEQCVSRIQKKGYGDCALQYTDFHKAVDKCVAKTLFSHLK
jgi:hypothetical protein